MVGLPAGQVFLSKYVTPLVAGTCVAREFRPSIHAPNPECSRINGRCPPTPRPTGIAGCLDRNESTAVAERIRIRVENRRVFCYRINMRLRKRGKPRDRSKMHEHPKINYVEFPCRDFERTKEFFARAFGWSFTDYGSNYTAFSGAGLDGGFYRADMASATESGSALIVFYSDSLDQALKTVREAGGAIVRDIFEFPGGSRFHFREPSGNEFAVWTEA